MTTSKRSTAAKAGRRPRPIDPAAHRYEAEKAALVSKGLSPVEYARACLAAARKSGL